VAAIRDGDRQAMATCEAAAYMRRRATRREVRRATLRDANIVAPIVDRGDWLNRPQAGW
jgi:hypothetical protein